MMYNKSVLRFGIPTMSLIVLQGSTLRKRKMYEEFLSKVSILGKCVQNPLTVVYFSIFFLHL